MLGYLDAGSLTLIASALAGGVAGVAMLLRMYGNKFLGIFSKSRRRKAEAAEAELLGVEIDPETGRPIAPTETSPTETAPTTTGSSEPR